MRTSLWSEPFTICAAASCDAPIFRPTSFLWPWGAATFGCFFAVALSCFCFAFAALLASRSACLRLLRDWRSGGGRRTGAATATGTVTSIGIGTTSVFDSESEGSETGGSATAAGSGSGSGSGSAAALVSTSGRGGARVCEAGGVTGGRTMGSTCWSAIGRRRSATESGFGVSAEAAGTRTPSLSFGFFRSVISFFQIDFSSAMPSSPPRAGRAAPPRSRTGRAAPSAGRACSSTRDRPRG